MKTLSRLVAGCHRETRVSMGSNYLTVDFGLPFGIKVLRKNVRSFEDAADKAVEAFGRISPKQRKEVAAFILSNPHSTQEAIWCAGKPRRADRKSILKP